MAYNYLDKTGLTKLWEKIKGKFVVKELKTDSDSEYKVLSDNNLTDELVEKIMNAGDSSFSGVYNDLTNKPQIEGHDLVGGNNTAASLGLATPSDVTNATEDMATQTWVSEQDYATTSAMSSAISTATTDMATKTWVQSQNYATTNNVNSLISAAVASVYTVKGSVASLDELNQKNESAKVGDVYNFSNEFTTDSGFVEGPGKTYPVGTNVVMTEVGGIKKWDVLSGIVDLSGYVAKTDMVAITDTEIDEICV